MGQKKLLVASGLSGLLVMGIGIASVAQAAAELTRLEALGEKLFNDANLSVNRTQSCVSCHDPDTGYTSPDSWVNQGGAVIEGAILGRFGNRKPPSAAYAGDSPVLHYDETEQAWIGGMFGDGRATGWVLGDPLAEQAQGPFLNPLEQAQPGARQVIIRVAHSDYADHFEAVWGTKSLDAVKNVDGSYERIVHSIAAYERSVEVSPFNSKFDLFWDNARAAGKDITRITAAGMPAGMGGGGMGGGGMGGGMGGGGMGGGGMGGNAENNPARWEHYRGLGLSDIELQGLAVFNDRAGCAECHTLTPGSAGYPLFTDFRYHNIGTPKNPENPFYSMPEKWNPDGENWVDNGLGEFRKNAGYPPEVYEPEMGKFRTPTLRNVDLRPSEDFVKAYGHNGFFKSLDGMDGIIHFYAWRAMMDNSAMSPNPNMFPAPEVDRNRAVMQPFGFGVDGGRLLAFLKTLSDGYFER